MATYTSQYPPSHNDTYVKATTYLNATYAPYNATNPANSLTGDSAGTQWVSNSATTNQRFHIDLGSSKIIRRVYYENGHDSGAQTDRGARNFTLWGSDSGTSFAELTYATDTGWTQLTTSASALDQHSASDAVDPKYFTITNGTAYRYYAFKFADNWGHATYMSMRRLTLQTQDATGYSFGVIL